MKRLIVVILSALSLTTALKAEDLFSMANQQYANGNYEDAVALYKDLLEQDSIQGDALAYVYYNMGNAYFRMNEVGLSILQYERALRLLPNMRDAKHNLEFAQQKIVDNIKPTNTFFLSQWLVAARNSLKYTTWMWIGIATFIIALMALMLFFFASSVGMRKTGFHMAWICLVISICSLCFTISSYKYRNDNTTAIVLQGIVNAKSSPDRSGNDLFVIHEGTKVKVTDTVGEWVEIHVGDNIGWIRNDNIEYINPKGN